MKKTIAIVIFIVLIVGTGLFLYIIRHQSCGVVGCYSKDFKGRTLLNGQPFGGPENGWK